MKHLLTCTALATALFASHAAFAKEATTAPADVTIYRDKMGVPHVYADTARAVFYGAGYAIAQDRLAQAEIDTRRQLGRMAELVGAAAVESDKEARTKLHTDAEIMAQFDALSPEYQSILRGMHEGWMRRVREVRADPKLMPYEFTKWGIQPSEWTLAEYLQTMGSVWLAYGSTGGKELTNLAFYKFLVEKFGEAKAKQMFDDVLPLDDVDATPIIPDGDVRKLAVNPPAAFPAQASLPVSGGVRDASAAASPLLATTSAPRPIGASRALAIGASKSATGNPMLLQATADGPDLHISGGGFDAAGYVFPSMSPIAQGRTPYNAWSLTTGESDLVDIFAEKLNPDNPRQYLYKGAWRDMLVRRETITVKGAPPVAFDVERTVHGPVVRREEKDRIAYAVANAAWGHELKGIASFIELSRVQKLDDIKAAAAASPGSFNWNYAGLDKHIAMIHSGWSPIRAKGVDPRLPTPGTGESDWQGFSPELDFMVDPKQGYFHAWNNKVTRNSHYGDSARYGKSFRTWLGRSLVEAKDKLSYADMQVIHEKIGRSYGGWDLTVTNPAFFAPYLREAVRGDPKLEAVVAAMASWDAIYEDKDKDGFYDNPGLTIYRAWIDEAQRSIIGDDIGDWWTNVDSSYITYRTDVLLRAIEGKDAGTPVAHDWFNGKPRAEVLRATIAATAAALEKQFSSSDIAKWRQRVFYRYYNPAAATEDKPSRYGEERAERTGGVSLMAGELGLQPPYIVNNGSEGWNMLVEVKPGDPTLFDSTPSGGQNLTITPDGKGNPNIADQVKLHENFEFKAVSLDPKVVKAEAVSTIRLAIPPAKP